MVGSLLNLTGLISSDIGIIFCTTETMIKNVVEGTVHPTTVTTSVTICFGAINEFLFREVVESFTSEGKGRF